MVDDFLVYLVKSTIFDRPQNPRLHIIRCYGLLLEGADESLSFYYNYDWISTFACFSAFFKMWPCITFSINFLSVLLLIFCIVFLITFTLFVSSW